MTISSKRNAVLSSKLPVHTFWKPILMALMLASVFSVHAATSEEVISKARALREAGQFKQAEAALSAALKDDSYSEAELKKISYEIDLIDRIRQDFATNKEELFGRLKRSVRDLTKEEFENWLKEGRFESRMVDGELRFAGTSVSNLFWRYPALDARRTPPRDKAKYYADLLKNSRAIRKAAAAEKSNYVLPTRFRIKMSAKVETNTVPAGETIRAWVPVPRKYPYPFQQDFKVISHSAPIKYLADETAPIRSAYLEQPVAKDGSALIYVTYEYQTHARRFELKPEESAPLLNDSELKKYLQEAPHVVFSDKIKKLGAKIVGSETNPVRKARAIYGWIADNLSYSYSLEYSTIPNISEYSVDRCWGDCGQQALTFITLCRSQGIPARWQSGLYLFPGAKNIHDWTEIYLAPWGWVPVDPEFGNAVMRYATRLTPDERKELHEFYFGGLDQYRMAANCDHNQELNPPKKTWRSDDVDFQRCELEWGSKNIYFNQYDYSMQIDYLNAP